MAEKKRKAEWQNRYIAKNYDRINLTVPKGQKATLEAAAAAAGESVNGYIQGALLARLGLTEWSKTKED